MHGVEVVGMFLFDDNTYVLRAGDRWASAWGGWPPGTEGC